MDLSSLLTVTGDALSQKSSRCQMYLLHLLIILLKEKSKAMNLPVAQRIEDFEQKLLKLYQQVSTLFKKG